MNKLITIAFGVACATALALSASATTYYYVGSKSEPAFRNSPNGGSGWSTTRDGTPVSLNLETQAAGNDFVMSSDVNTDLLDFKGETLTIEGGAMQFKNNSPAPKYTFKKIIMNPGGSIKPTMGNNVTMLFDSIEFADTNCSASFCWTKVINGGVFTVGGTGGKIIGKGQLKFRCLAPSGISGCGIDLAADASEFSGPVSFTDPDVLGDFVFRISDKFAGYLVNLPDSMSDFRVKYDGLLPAGQGLRMSEQAIPAALKTKLTFWTDGSTDFTEKNLPLITFTAAGTGVDVEEFTIYHHTAKTGTGTKFENLGLMINEDGTKTIVANYEGPQVDVNTWLVEMNLTKTSWQEREDDPGVLTEPIPKYGASLMKRTINGERWNGEMPTAPGTYTIVWSVDATAEYTDLSVSCTFTINAFVDSIDYSFRYLKNGERWWRGTEALRTAITALDGAGGIVEVNTNVDVSAGAQLDYPINDSTTIRGCSDPRRAGRKIVYTVGSTAKDYCFKISKPNVSVSISNLVFEAARGLEGCLFKITGADCSLRMGANAVFGTAGACSASVVELNSAGARPTVCFEGLVVTNLNVACSLVNVGAANARVVVGKGTRICNNQSVSLNVARADSTVDLFGGVLTGNTVSEALVKSAGPINVKGSPVVWNNKTSAGAQANVKPADATKINLVGDLEEGACVGVTCGGKGGDQFGVWTDGEAKKGFVCDAKPNLLTRIKNGLLLWSTPGMLISIF